MSMRLGVARAGRYPATLLDSVSPERRERFFVQRRRQLCRRQGGAGPLHLLAAQRHPRSAVLANRSRLLPQPADLFRVGCQSQVIPIFHYALRPDGYLFLGTSENISQFADLFRPVEKKHRIFRRRSDDGSAARLPLSLIGSRPGHWQQASAEVRRSEAVALRQSVESQVLDQFAPPYVVVNREGDVVFYSGRTGKYLEAAPGLPTRQMSRHRPQGAAASTCAPCFREAADAGRAVTRDGIAVESDDGRVQVISLTVAPAASMEAMSRCFSYCSRPGSDAEPRGSRGPSFTCA